MLKVLTMNWQLSAASAICFWTLCIGCSAPTPSISELSNGVELDIDDGEAVIEFDCLIDGKKMYYRIDSEQIANRMNWEEGQANPPVPVRKAIAISGDVLELFAKTNLITSDRDWILRSVNLDCVNLEVWYYKIIYYDIVWDSEVHIVVFMDGSTTFPRDEVHE
jgi:hypothetical protein